MNAWKRLAAGCTAALLIGIAGCSGHGAVGGGGGTGSTSQADPNSAATTLDGKGGTVATASGVTVTVPAGALAASTTIRIAKDSTGAPPLPTSMRAVGDSFALTPHGTAFNADVTLKMPAPSVTLADNEQLVLAKAQPGGQWELQPTTVEGGNLVTQVRSFSILTAAVVTFPQPIRVAAPLALTISSPTCNGLPCDQVSGIGPWTVRATVSSNLGALPKNCASPLLTLIVGGQLNGNWGGSSIQVPLALGLVTQQASATVPAPSDSLSLVATLLCTDLATGTHPLTAFYGPQFDLRGPRSSDGYIEIAEWPEALTAIAGTPASLRALIFTGHAYPPTQDVQGMVEWQRSLDGGASWRPEGSTRQLDGLQPSWIRPSSPDYWNSYWNAVHGITPSMADNGSFWRLKACWVDVTQAAQPKCVTSKALTLTVLPSADPPSFSQQPRDMMVVSGQTASFTTMATANPAITGWQWQSRLANSQGAWTDIAGATSATYTTPVLSLADTGTQYHVIVTNAAGSTTSDTVTASVSNDAVAPAFTGQPLSLSVITGSEAVFAVSVRGTDALSYQWRKNGVNIVIPGVNANSYTLKLPAAALGDAGAYSVVVSNSVGTITSQDAMLTVSNAPPVVVAPTIVTHPANVQVHVGDSATLGVGVGGTGPFTYQWFKDGTQPANAIAGATQATYTITSAANTDAGSYSVRVTNSAGSVTSAAATLTVQALPTGGGSIVAPTIDTQPATITVSPGLGATLAVGASGSGPLQYQWSLNGTDIVGAVYAAYTIPAATSSDAGNYRVRVWNSAGTVLSSVAQVVVVGAPAITIDLADISVPSGSDTTFAVSATGNGLHYVWLRNGEPYAGSTDSPTLSVPVTMADGGSLWRVLAYNGAGIAFSRTASLAVTYVASCTGPNNTGWCAVLTANQTTDINVTSAFAFNNAGVGIGIEPYTIRRTTDGGVTWATMLPGFGLPGAGSNYNLDVAFTDPNTALVAGYALPDAFHPNVQGDWIYRSTNAGLSWAQVYTGPTNPAGARSFAFLDANVGVLTGYSTDYLRTTDGGLTWDPMTFDMPASGVGGVTTRSLGTVQAVGGNLIGYAGTNSGRAGDNIVVKSTDGGISWTQLAVLPGTLIKMSFADASHGVISGSDQAAGSNALLRTTDGGRTWTTVLLDSWGFYDLKLASDGSGVAVAADAGIMYTADFGATWHAAQGGYLANAYPYSVGLVRPGQFVVGVADLTTPSVNQPLILRNTQGGAGP